MRCTCLGATPKEAYADWAFLEQVERDRLSKAHTLQLSPREMRDYWAA